MLVVYLNTSNNNHTFTLPRRATWLIFLKIFNKLAQSLRDKICANLIDFIKEIIFSATFLEQHRQKKTDFTRSRLLPFTSLVLYLCNFTKLGIRFSPVGTTCGILDSGNNILPKCRLS
jgi:hypothetical protein